MSTVDMILALCRKLQPTAQAHVSVMQTAAGNTRFAKNEITSSGAVDEAKVSITLAFGKRVASTARNQTDEASLRRQVETTARIAQLTPEDPETLPVLGPQTYAKYPSATDASTKKASPELRAKIASEAIAAAEREHLQIAGFLEHQSWQLAMGTSAGLRASTEGTDVGLTMTARTLDGTGSGWSGATSHRIADIDSAALTKIAVEKAVRSAKPRKLEPGRYTVILESEAVMEMVRSIGFDARSADEGRSPFSKSGGGTKVGETLFAPDVTLACNSIDPSLPIPAFDDSGLPHKPFLAVDKGKLNQLTYSRYWAEKNHVQPTGRDASIVLRAGTTPEAQLIKECKRGLLITRFWYVRMLDPTTLTLTGLTRDGVFLIENGEITAPVNNFRFNESPLQVLKNVEAIGNIVRRGDGVAAPALRTAQFNMASISDAV